MYSIFDSYRLRLTGAVAALALFPAVLQAQEAVPADTVKAGQTEKVRMPYHVKGRVVDAVTGKGFAGARVTTPEVSVSAMTDENGEYEIGLPDLRVPLYVDAPGYSRQVVPVRGRTQVDVSLYMATGHAYYDDAMSVTDGRAVVDGFTAGTLNMVDDMNSLLAGQLRTSARSGEPGASASYFVRGLNSLNLSSQPLFVVDGVVRRTVPLRWTIITTTR